MTYPIYSPSNLASLTITAIEVIANQIGAIPDGDKRVKQTWLSAVLDHQTKFSPAKVEVMEAYLDEVMDRDRVPQDLAEDLALNLLDLAIVDRQVTSQ